MTYQTIRLLGGATVTADPGNVAVCKFCKKDIIWAVTKNVKNIPMVQDQSGNWMAHMTDCSGWPANKKEKMPVDLLDEVKRQAERDLFNGWPK